MKKKQEKIERHMTFFKVLSRSISDPYLKMQAKIDISIPMIDASPGYVFGMTPRITEFYELGKQIGQPGQFGAARLCTFSFVFFY